MNAQNAKLFLQWYENHADTYTSFFSLTKPERKYWLNELYTRFKAYVVDRTVYMDIIMSPILQMPVLTLTTRGNRHMLSGDSTVQKPAGIEPGWHILAWNIVLPPGMDKSEAMQSTLDDLKQLEIKPFQAERKITGWEVELYTDESVKEKVYDVTSIMMMRVIGPLARPHNTDINFNSINGLSSTAKKGLLGVLAIPRPVRKGMESVRYTDTARRN